MSSPGRPRTFDREQALNEAMELFWALGYEGATLTELQRAMGGITAPSLYAAFGSKGKLFREAVDLYSKTQGIRILKALTDESTARESVESLLMGMAEFFSQPAKPHGILVILGAINCMRDNRSVQDYLRDRRANRQKVILQRLQRGVAEGDLAPDIDLEAIATFYSTVMNGLAIQARDGATREDLKTTVGCAMAAWDTLVKQEPKINLRTTPTYTSTSGLKKRESLSCIGFFAPPPGHFAPVAVRTGTEPASGGQTG